MKAALGLICGATISLALVGCKTAAPQPAVVTCECEAGCVSACSRSQNTSYRTVEREAKPTDLPKVEEPETIFEPVDAIAYPRLDDDAASAAADRLDVKGDSVIAMFEGDFARSKGDEIAVVTPTALEVFASSGSALAKIDLGEVLADREIFAVRLVDSRAEVVLHHRIDNAGYVSVYRVIGAAIGRVFTAPIANEVSFVHHGDERAIQVRADQSTSVYRWNKWEGVFRIPSPAPTAPLR